MQFFFVSLQTDSSTSNTNLSLFIVRGLMVRLNWEGTRVLRNLIQNVTWRGRPQGLPARLIEFIQRTVENTGVRLREERGATLSTSPSLVCFCISKVTTSCLRFKSVIIWGQLCALWNSECQQQSILFKVYVYSNAKIYRDTVLFKHPVASLFCLLKHAVEILLWWWETLLMGPCLNVMTNSRKNSLSL